MTVAPLFFQYKLEVASYLQQLLAALAQVVAKVEVAQGHCSPQTWGVTSSRCFAFILDGSVVISEKH